MLPKIVLLVIILPTIMAISTASPILHAHPDSSRDDIFSGFGAVTLHSTVIGLQFGLPTLLCGPDLHRQGDGAVEVMDCFGLLEPSWAE
jgi:hypothetical protein